LVEFDFLLTVGSVKEEVLSASSNILRQIEESDDGMFPERKIIIE